MTLPRSKRIPGTALGLAMALPAFGACGSDSRSPMEPGPSPAPDVRYEVLERLLHDALSVEGLSAQLRDRPLAEAIRGHAEILARDLEDEDLAKFGQDLGPLERAAGAYRGGPGFDPREGILLEAIDLYVAESRGVLEGRAFPLPILNVRSE